MTLVYEEEDGLALYVKGAPEVILERSSVASEDATLVEAAAEDWASAGLAGARRRRAPASWMRTWTTTRSSTISGSSGLVALHDPLRETRVRRGRGGARGRPARGDADRRPSAHRESDRPRARPAREAIHARVTPAEKLRLVEALQSRAARSSPSPETESTTRPPFDGRTSGWRWGWRAPRRPARPPTSSSRTTTSPRSSPRSGKGARSPTTSASSSRSCSPQTSARLHSSPSRFRPASASR